MTDPIQLAVEQLYENEALTDALMDEAAKMLLGWGERQLRDMEGRDDMTIEQVTQHLQYPMKTINRLMQQHAELSETEMMQRLLKLVEQSMQLAHQKSLRPSPGDSHED